MDDVNESESEVNDQSGMDDLVWTRSPPSRPLRLRQHFKKVRKIAKSESYQWQAGECFPASIKLDEGMDS